ncbi:ubiquinol-cytochrome c reductase cytochrome b subunit [Streptomyces sp. JJ36]|uniref:cytochrome bc1 complex cytochrome b subunit n=1 Tax=Streptomyces sp. JJ36 TaxID=2736645 RepID=UPI001F316D76|nr:ubiquinol-cytochrome c reductase cytochrome b subunit [Streptomyces sp. JJ36]
MDRRLPASEGAGLLRKAFPDHWSFLLGELALYSLLVLVLTGVYLTFFFDPSMTEVVYHGDHVPLQGVRMSEAYASTIDISFDVRGGLLTRQIHHWAALVFVAAIGVHLLRIFFTGAFRRPREANWVLGVTLFILAVVEGFAGYSLPDDLLSGTGLRIAQGIMTSIPVVGTYVAFFVFGGQYPGHDIIPRLYVTHILLVPGILIALVVVHLVLVVYLKHTQWAKPGRTNRNAVGQPMVPHFTAKSAGLSFLVFGVLTVMAGTVQINPVWVYGPYDPSQISMFSQPDWYVGFLEGSLRLMPPFETHVLGHTIMWNVFVPAVLLPALLFLCLFVYPFFERWVTGDDEEHHLLDRPRNRPTRTGLGVAGVTFYAVLLMAGGNDVLAVVFQVSVNALTWTFRISLVVAPVLAYLLTKRVCLALQAADRQRLEEGEETGQVHVSVEGGMAETHTSLPAERAHHILVREQPRPLTLAQLGAGHRPTRRQRLRVRLSQWFHHDSVDFTVAPGPRREIARRLAGPRHAGPGETEDQGERAAD